MKRPLSQGIQGTTNIPFRCVWTTEEDEALRESALRHKGECWKLVAEEVRKTTPPELQSKTSKQCRERWNNQVNPKIQLKPISEEEITELFKLHEEFGNQWSKISCRMPGRTDNIIKNFFLCKLRRVMRSIKKGVTKSSSPKNEKEFFHIFYLMDYLYKFYISSERQENIRKSLNSQTKKRRNNGDRYINTILQNENITIDKLSSLAKTLVDTLSFSIDSNKFQKYEYLLSLTQSKPLFDLAMVTNFQNHSNFKNESTNSLSRIFIHDILAVFDTKFPKDNITLPLIDFTAISSMKLDDFKPIFNFNAYSISSFGLSIDLESVKNSP